MEANSPVLTINGRKIGHSFSPYIIAEMSANHGKSLEHAKSVISSAKKFGADAVKTPDVLCGRRSH